MNPIIDAVILIEQKEENGFREVGRGAREVFMKEKNRFYFKACPKCRGDMYLDQDVYGVFAKCLQCGRIYEANNGQSKVDQVGSDKMAA